MKKNPNLWALIRVHNEQIYETASKTVLSLFSPYRIFSLNSFILYFMTLLPKPSFSWDFYQSLKSCAASPSLFVHGGHRCVGSVLLWVQSLPWLDHGYCNAICEELGARAEVELAPWALLQDTVMGTFRSPALKELPTWSTSLPAAWRGSSSLQL